MSRSGVITTSRAQARAGAIAGPPLMEVTWGVLRMPWVPTIRFAMAGGGTRAARKGPVRVVICDDSQVVLSSLHRILARHEGIDVVGLVESFEELTGWMKGGDADVVLLDVRLPGESGVSGLKSLRRNGDATPVVLMSAYPQHSTAATRAGAVGFFHKSVGNSSALADMILGAAGRPPPARPGRS